jgi:hypothetical protein
MIRTPGVLAFGLNVEKLMDLHAEFSVIETFTKLPKDVINSYDAITSFTGLLS